MTAAAVLGTTGTIASGQGDTAAAVAGRAARWSLQNTAKNLLPHEKGLQGCCSAAARLAPGGADPAPRAAVRDVEVWAKDGRTFFKGLQQCGSVWLCPVCSGKISEKRRAELQGCIDSALNRAQPMGVTLVTLTVRHGRGDMLADLLSKFSRAQRRLKSSRAYRRLLADFGIVGEVRALEVTHGKNGWHPHSHAITFSALPILENRVSYPRTIENNARSGLPGRTLGIVQPIARHRMTQLKRRVFVLWFKACVAEGLPAPDYLHGVDIRGAKYAAAYAAKWGFSDELTKAMRKKGRDGGRNPWELLADARAGDRRAAWLFREYAQHFKGKRQLFYSKITTAAGAVSLLKHFTGDDEMTDQQALDLSDAVPPPAEMVAVLDADTWACIIKADARAAVLEAAREGSPALFGLLNRLRVEVGLYGRTLEAREDWET